MKCEFCEKEMPDDWKHILFQRKRNDKLFCDDDCLENFYIRKIDQLTKSEKAWHDEWFKQREIIGKLGCKYVIEPRFESNKITNGKTKDIENDGKD